MNDRPQALQMTAGEAIDAFKTKLRNGMTNLLFTDAESLAAKTRSAYNRLEEVGLQYDKAYANLSKYDNPDIANTDPKDKGAVAQLQRELAQLDAEGARWGADLKSVQGRLQGELAEKERDALQAHANELSAALDELQVKYTGVQARLDKLAPMAADMLDSFNTIAATYHEAEADYVMLRDHGDEILDAIKSVDMAYDMRKTSANVASTKRVSAGDVLSALDQKFVESSAKLAASKKRTAPPAESAVDKLRKTESQPNRWK